MYFLLNSCEDKVNCSQRWLKETICELYAVFSVWMTLYYIFMAGITHVPPVCHKSSSLCLWCVGIMLLLHPQNHTHTHIQCMCVRACVILWVAVWRPLTANPFHSEIIQWQLTFRKTPELKESPFGADVSQSLTCQKIIRRINTTYHGCWFRFNKVTTKARITKSRWTWLCWRSRMFSLNAIWKHYRPSCGSVGVPCLLRLVHQCLRFSWCQRNDKCVKGLFYRDNDTNTKSSLSVLMGLEETAG